MKPIARLFLLVSAWFLWTSSTASAQFSDGWWFLNFEDTTGAALQPLHIGIDPGDGIGFSFSTLPDHDGDGVIRLPPVPNNGGLVMGVDVDGEVGCDIWIFIDTSMSGGTGAQIHHPLLIVAEDVAGQAFGMDSSPFSFPFPPNRALVPGERLTATDGQLADWPDLRLAAGPEPADLPDFLRTVDTWPNFSGEVIVTSLLLSGTFVPEPASWLLLLGGATAFTSFRRIVGRS